MRVYHYLEAKWGLDNIRRRRLKVSKIDDMNDPYELEFVCSEHFPSQWALNNSKIDTAERCGMLCFSKRWNSILMWSHYGENHKGICLGFDVPDINTVNIEYQQKRLEVGNVIAAQESEMLKIVNDNCFTKYDGWDYEEEVRIFLLTEEKDKKTGLYFVDFDKQLILREVIKGVRFQMSNKPIKDALRGYSGNVRISKVAKSSKKYEMIMDESDLEEVSEVELQTKS